MNACAKFDAPVACAICYLLEIKFMHFHLHIRKQITHCDVSASRFMLLCDVPCCFMLLHGAS